MLFKFYFWILLALTLSVAGAAGVVSLFSYHGVEERIGSWARVEVEVGRDIAAGLLDMGIAMDDLGRILSPLAVHSPLTVAIAGPGGEQMLLLTKPGLESSPRIFPEPEEIRRIIREGELIDLNRKGRFAVGVPLSLPSGETGVFFVTVGKERWKKGRWHWELFAGLGVFLGFLWLLSWPLAAHLARPLRKMAAAATALGEGDLSVRIQIKRRDEIGQLADSFNAMADNLQRMIAGHKQLLADISHELRSPLARLRIALELARQEGGAEVETSLGRLEKQADTMEEMIGELLTYSHLEASPHTLRKEALSLTGLISEAVSAHLPDASLRQIRVDVRGGEDPAMVSGDRTLLERALGNVVRNGIAHAPEGSSLQLALQSGEGRYLITVTDLGQGVPPDMLERIFEPFVRADTARSRATGGVGLGLAIARRCMEAHGGGAFAEPGPGGTGLTITLWLPKNAQSK